MKKINSKKQNGAALAIGMILLLIISVIGVSSMKSALLQDKMASGLNNREIADSAALSLLVRAEEFVFNYYQTSNGVDLVVGSPYTIAPHTDQAYDFRTQKNMSNGFNGLININSIYGGILNEEPTFVIESLSDAAAGEDDGGNSYGTTGGESNNSSAGGSTDESGEIKLYRIVSKATDTTGHIYSAFESTISAKH